MWKIWITSAINTQICFIPTVAFSWDNFGLQSYYRLSFVWVCFNFIIWVRKQRRSNKISGN